MLSGRPRDVHRLTSTGRSGWGPSTSPLSGAGVFGVLLALIAMPAIVAGQTVDLDGPWLALKEPVAALTATEQSAVEADSPVPPETESISTESEATEQGDSENEEDVDQGGSELAEPQPDVAEQTGPPLVGEPLAPGILDLLRDEMVNGFRRRNIESQFRRFERYAGQRLDISVASYTGSELNGRCRLSWYDHLLRTPLTAPREAEQFTRELHQAVLNRHDGLGTVLAIAAEKLDLPQREPKTATPVGSADEAIAVVRRALDEAQMAYCEALAPLSKSEISNLSRNLYRVFGSENDVGHTLQSRVAGRQLCDLIKKMDREAVIEAAEALVPVSDTALLERLGEMNDEGRTSVGGAQGTVVRRINTPSGDIVIGGRGSNQYNLDDMPGVAAVIDLGGNDTYYNGTVSLRRPVLLVIDLDGDDTYSSQQPGAQGAAILGISMLLDVAGNDTYRAYDVAQGSCLAGAGILIDYAGNDSYLGVRRAQGVALGGVGLLIDRNGDDRYKAALWTQGIGNPLGFGMLDDLDGADHYYAGGRYPNSYLKDDNPTPGYEGWGQGVGGGLRQVANGGIGVMLDGGGDDVYEFDYLSHGGGYWCGVGFARDFGGNDRRLGATVKAYDGGPRTQRSYQRFGCGFGCHYSLGFVFDDAGDDTYDGTIMGTGHAWDCSVGYLCDFGGDDRYEATGGLTQGSGAQAGLGVLFDYDGDDVYRGYGQGRASSGMSYHPLPDAGGNFAFAVDYGGEDQYGCRARNNSYNRRGSNGGFLIDRPRDTPTEQAATKPDTHPAAGS